MPDKTKFFRVATEGSTATDGREIKKSWIEDMAANYNAATYGARVNMEHIRGATGQAPFKALGDVTALQAREVEIQLNGAPTKRLALYAQIDPTADLVALTKDRQKIYTSIEVTDNFANTGKAGLVGLAVTDTPASLATEILKFSTTADNAAAAAVKADLDRRKQSPTNLFSAAEETTVELETAAAAGGGDDFADKLFGALRRLFSGSSEVASDSTRERSVSGQREAPAGAAGRGGASADDDRFARLEQIFNNLDQQRTDARAQAEREELATVKRELAELKAQGGRTDASTQHRPAAVGGGDFTACDF